MSSERSRWSPVRSFPSSTATPRSGASGPGRLWRRSARRLFRHLPRAAEGVEEAIHQLRVNGRRLRVWLPLLAARPEGRRARRALRRLRCLTRAAGLSRDQDVVLALLRQDARTVSLDPRHARRLLGRLAAERRRSRRTMARVLRKHERSSLRRDLQRLPSRWAKACDALARLDEAWEAQRRRVLGSIGSLDRLEAEALHRLRRDCRRLRFISELRDRARAAASPLPELLKRAQAALGAIHDDRVAQQWLEGRARAARARGQEALAGAALRLAERFRRDGQARRRALLASGLRRGLSACLEDKGEGGACAGQAWRDASGS